MSANNDSSLQGYAVEVFFDGDCPLCVREIKMLQRMDRKRNRIRFTDIAAPGFDPAPLGLTFAEMMDQIRGRLPDGTLIQGVEVFRQLYTAVGLGPLVGVTRWWGVRQAMDAAYEAFAKNRLKLTGRCIKDESGVCAIPAKG